MAIWGEITHQEHNSDGDNDGKDDEDGSDGDDGVYTTDSMKLGLFTKSHLTNF